MLLLVLPSLLFSQQSKENVDVVPFAKIENVPIYPGCDKSSNEKRENVCLKELQSLLQRSSIKV